MLEPQSRATFTELLKPPTGFELVHAVGTTFTLDLASALAVPLSFASHRLASQGDTLGVLDAIRRASEHIDVFAQAGEISMGARSDLVAFLEPMVHPVALRQGLFHPKVWFLEYRAGDRTAFRFLCASRNLTADRSWDIVVKLDGAPASESDAPQTREINQPLVDLLRRLPTLAVHPLEAARRARIDALTDRWATVAWERPAPMRSVAFHVFGVGRDETPDLHGKRALIVSPFLSDDGLRMLRSRVRTDTHVLSRAESLERLLPSSLDAKLTSYVLDEAAIYSDEEAGDGDRSFVPPGERLVGLHAKAVVVDRLDGAHVLLGSANATDAGWRRNVEVMVEFVGPVKQVGVQATLDALGEVRSEYRPQGGNEPDDNEVAARKLESFVRGLASSRFSMRMLPDSPYALRVWAEESVAEKIAQHADTYSVRWHLLTRPDLGNSAVGSGESEGIVLPGIPLADITPFIVLAARDSLGNERKTVVLARLYDDVDSRRDAVIARQLTDHAAFVRLLTLLLELSGGTIPTGTGSGGAGFFGAADSATGTGLFESLVRAVGEGHRGLSDARRIIDYLREHDEGSVLPDGFDELWAEVWSAHLELTGGNR